MLLTTPQVTVAAKNFNMPWHAAGPLYSLNRQMDPLNLAKIAPLLMLMFVLVALVTIVSYGGRRWRRSMP